MNLNEDKKKMGKIANIFKLVFFLLAVGVIAIVVISSL